ncbi:Histone-Lysine N-Methyltransferase Setdb1 [Manis pentadactyla]|nr:Histone-Lysine N-Methyltransferase Setdb1 [Manis pentadactyla]
MPKARSVWRDGAATGCRDRRSCACVLKRRGTACLPGWRCETAFPCDPCCKSQPFCRHFSHLSASAGLRPPAASGAAMTAAELQAGTARTFQSPPPGQRQPHGKQNLQITFKMLCEVTLTKPEPEVIRLSGTEAGVFLVPAGGQVSVWEGWFPSS